ncbi:hypothetical protein [Actinophytocola xanthii]|nr:hypothetical protein [Actinophytocola xanthii]
MDGDEDRAGVERAVAGARDAFNASDNGQFARYEVTGVWFPEPELAFAHVAVDAATADGEPLEIDHSMRSVFVLGRTGVGWEVLAREDRIVAK